MINFPVRRAGGRTCLALFLLIFAAGQACGQEAVGSEAVRVSEISALRASDMGVLSAEAGLGENLWDSSDGALVISALHRLKSGKFSYSLSMLTRPLLLGTAPAPDSDPALYLAARAQVIYALGANDAVIMLAEQASNSEKSETLHGLHMLALLAKGHVAQACETQASGLRAPMRPIGMSADEGAANMVKLRALCAARAGDEAGVTLALDLARETEIKDRFFFVLVQNLLKRQAGASSPVPVSDGKFTAIHHALFKEIGYTLPDDVAARAEPALLLQLAMDEALDARTRIESTERAFEFGLISAEEAGAVYLKFPKPAPDDISDAARAPSEAEARAFAYQALANAPGADSAMTALSSLLNDVWETSRFPLVARLTAPFIPAPDAGVWDNKMIARFTAVLASVGFGERAQAFRMLFAGSAEQAAVLDVILSVNGLSLWPTEYDHPPKAARAWQLRSAAVLQGLNPAQPGQQALRAQQALDDDMLVFDERPTAHPVLLQRLSESVRLSRRGEGILLVLTMLSQSGIRQSADLSVVHAVESLSRWGLASHARAIALEAIMPGAFELLP